ncbi:hypothetical protein HHI36_010773 [Cryptolaemus montrouzieri]|uniref:Uncharacterized protein n=1 Tax=Cryptolaemus montrouzieri TaxID=559131 RepID=A0ABD2MJV4_9CUCU
MFMMNPFWLHNNQRDQCTCLEQLYQTAIEIVYRNFLLFKDNQLRSDRELQDDHNLMEGISDLQKLSLFEEIPCLQSAKLDLL